MVRDHSVNEEQLLCRRMVERFEAIGVRREEIQIAVVENGFEDWSARSF